MPEISEQILLRLSVNVHDSPPSYGDIQITRGIDLKGRLTPRVGEIILRRVVDFQEALIADLVRGDKG